MIQASIPLIGVVAYSGTGKTTLLEKVLPLISHGGIRLGVIKHAHHSFEMDTPGKDSYRLREAGAQQMLLASNKQWVLMQQHTLEDEPRLQDCVNRLDQSQLDLIIIEGFKHEAYPKIELHRPSLGKDLIYPTDDTVKAIATDEPDKLDTQLPILDINDPAAIANYILAHVLGRADA
ncbi:MAG: molybdopterin-guanine dinucleotide biosynthesis protein B [Gammaproteobacteria bacterium]|nr:molybdopterin-guanine dinucleotide biosynthesis protein B [Gammaproteobacteria bacterium]